MHAQPPRTLKRLLKQYGQELIDDPRRTEALLRDYCGQHTREIFVLVNAQKQRVPNELLAAPTWMPRQATHSRLVRLLETKLAITEDAAEWAVSAWATALELEPSNKHDAWSWLPEPLRAPASQSTRKTRNKKRQNSPTGVQYPKGRSGSSARQAKERALRAELGWSFPTIDIAQWAKQLTSPSFRATLLAWAGLIAMTVFLLGFIYWSSTSRNFLEDELGALDTAAIAPVNAEETARNAVDPIAEVDPASQLTQSELSQLSKLPREYLNDVMPLPTRANVNDSVVTLNIRQHPTVDSNILAFLSAGESIEVVAYSEDGRWSQIQYPRLGWVSNDFLIFKSQDVTQTSVRLNFQLLRTKRYEVAVRAGPYANAKVIATLPADEAVVVAATVGEPSLWVQIADPTIGWVAINDLTATP